MSYGSCLCSIVDFDPDSVRNTDVYRCILAAPWFHLLYCLSAGKVQRFLSEVLHPLAGFTWSFYFRLI